MAMTLWAVMAVSKSVVYQKVIVICAAGLETNGWCCSIQYSSRSLKNIEKLIIVAYIKRPPIIDITIAGIVIVSECARRAGRAVIGC